MRQEVITLVQEKDQFDVLQVEESGEEKTFSRFPNEEKAAAAAVGLASQKGTRFIRHSYKVPWRLSFTQEESKQWELHCVAAAEKRWEKSPSVEIPSGVTKDTLFSGYNAFVERWELLVKENLAQSIESIESVEEVRDEEEAYIEVEHETGVSSDYYFDGSVGEIVGEEDALFLAQDQEDQEEQGEQGEQGGQEWEEVEVAAKSVERSSYLDILSERLGAEKEEIMTGDVHTVSPNFLGNMREKLVLVSLSIGRWRGTTALSQADLGIAELQSEGDAVLKDYVQLGRISLIPKVTQNRLLQLESGARESLKDYAFKTVWGYCLPISMWRKWKTGNDQARQEYMNLCLQIAADIESTKTELIKKLKPLAKDSWVRMFGKEQDPTASFVDSYVSRIVQKFPTANEISHSCFFRTQYSFLPETISSEDSLTNEVHEEIKKEQPEMQSLSVYKSLMLQTISALKSEFGDTINSIDAVDKKVQKRNHIINPRIKVGIESTIERYRCRRIPGDDGGLLNKIDACVDELDVQLKIAPAKRDKDAIVRLLTSAVKECDLAIFTLDNCLQG